MVQELNGLSSSQFINNRTTFISTAFNGGDYELRKYPIANLDHAFKIYPAIAKKICQQGSTLSSFFSLSKSKGFPIK